MAPRLPDVDLSSAASPTTDDPISRAPVGVLMAEAATRWIGSARLVRWLASAGLAAVALSTALIGLLHLMPPTDQLNPLSRTISEYALLPTGWIFDVGVLVLSFGSALVLAALMLAGGLRPVSWATAMIGLWCVGLVGLIVFPKYGFGADNTLAGRVHWSWTLIAFFSLPIGATLTCRAREGGLIPTRWRRWAVRLSIVAAGWFGVLVLQTVLAATTALEAWRLVGLVERGLSVTEMATVAVLALWVRELVVPEAVADPGGSVPSGADR